MSDQTGRFLDIYDRVFEVEEGDYEDVQLMSPDAKVRMTLELGKSLALVGDQVSIMVDVPGRAFLSHVLFRRVK